MLIAFAPPRKTRNRKRGGKKSSQKDNGKATALKILRNTVIIPTS